MAGTGGPIRDRSIGAGGWKSKTPRESFAFFHHDARSVEVLLQPGERLGDRIGKKPLPFGNGNPKVLGEP